MIIHGRLDVFDNFSGAGNRAAIEDEHVFRVLDGTDKPGKVGGNSGQTEPLSVTFIAQFHGDLVGHLSYI
jgi:hypothetical protein